MRVSRDTIASAYSAGLKVAAAQGGAESRCGAAAVKGVLGNSPVGRMAAQLPEREPTGGGEYEGLT